MWQIPLQTRYKKERVQMHSLFLSDNSICGYEIPPSVMSE